MTNSETVLGKYRIKEELRKRREGVVYLGVDIEINQAVIFTVLDAELIHPQQFLARFELIAETLKGIDSPYGAALLDYGEQEGQAIIVQEYVEGQSLSEMLTDSDGLPENLVLDIAQQVGEYLRDLHQADLLHGSLSPDTILLTSKGTVQVRDAGLAQGMNLNQLLADGNIGASPIHAPETRSGGELTPATDFYALGATLFDLLTGEKLELEPADLWPGNKRQGLSPELDELVFKCLQVDPARRMQSAAELLNGIQETRRGSQAGGQDTILGMEDVLVGHTLGAYQLTERLGQGGMATVYKAYEPALDRYVAIKVLPQFFARDPNFMNRFRREAKAVAQLNHPSIMPIYSYGEEGDITYIAMQYVPGGTLKQGRGQVYEPAEGIRLALPIVRALAYAHQRGIVHRDIKPSNVLLGENDWPVLADFGLAKMAEASQQLTGTGVGVGTPMYMSPEQGQGTDVDHRTDIYSMGIMLYEMLTGDVPFRADTPMAVVIKHMTAPLPMPREANPGIPEALERIILKATAKSADDRYQTAEEMITALERVQNSLLAPTRDAEAADVTVPALREPETPPPPREAAPLARTLKKAGIILGGIIGVLLLGLILMWVFDICPPEGPWPIPPWCPGSTYKLPTIGGEEETPAVITDGDLGSILFQEDFDDSLSNRWTFWPTAWGMEQESGRSVLRSAPLDLSISETITAEIRGTNWQNYAIEFDFRFSQPDQFGAHYFWVIGRITDCPPNVHAMQGYGTLISPDEVTLVKDTCVAGSRQTIEKSDKDIVVEGWHTLQYIFIGNRVQLYIDGEKYADYTDATDPLDGGDLWIELVGDSELMIDNLKVYEVIPGEGGLEGVVSPTSLCAPGETLLFYEDFESGYQDGWYFQNAAGEETEPWSIVDDGTGNYVIQGHEHNLAHYTGFSQNDIEFRLRMRKGMPPDNTHINFGMSEAGRYYLSVDDQINLTKDPDESLLGTGSYGAQTEWHDIKISSVDGQIKVYVDDQLKLDYQDADPLPGGAIAIENTYGLIWYDDLVVCSASSQAGGDVIVTEKTYADDFENGFADFWNDSAFETWHIEDVGESSALLGSGPIQISEEGFVLEDFKFDIDFNFTEPSSTEGYYGAAFFFRQDDCSSYYLEIYPEGGGLSKHMCEADSINYSFDLPLDINPGEWHHVQVYMMGNHIRVLVDDDVMLDFADDGGEPIEAGEFSFGGHEFEEITYFDNFSLEVLESAQANDLFTDSGQRLGERYTRAIAAGDIDNDGDMDIITGNTGTNNAVWINTGDSLFIPGFEISQEDDTYIVSPGDYDGDGDLDLFITNWAGASYLLSNNGLGVYEKSHTLTSDIGVSEAFGSATGDLDGDGDLDIWMAAGGSNYVWMNDGGGAFSLSDGEYHGADSVGIALGDLDGDGDLDAFVANYDGGANFVYMNQGNGSFIDSGQRLGNSASNAVALGDLDDDGDLDAFVANLEDQPNTVWLNNGAGAFVDSGQRLDQLTSNAAALGDLDNDGDLDAYVVNGKIDAGEPKSNTIYLNDGLGNFSTIEHQANLTISTDVVLLDLNGDGWLDIVEATTETILIWFNQGIFGGATEETTTTFENPADEARAFAEPILAAIADRPPDYEDDFSDPESGWLIGSNADGDEWGYEDDAGFISVVGRNAGTTSERAPRFSDFVLEVDARFVSGDWGFWGVSFREFPRTIEQPVSAGYGVAFNPDGLFNLGKEVSNVYIDLLEYEVTAPIFEQGFSTNRLTIIAQGPQIAIYMNGEPLWFVYDESSSIGQIGLGVENLADIPLRVHFDNFKVWDISEAGSAPVDVSDASSPCDFTLDDVGKTAKVAGMIAFVDNTMPNVWYADLMGDGCNLGMSVDSGRYPEQAVWFDEAPEAFVVGASIVVEGTFVSFPYPNNPEQMQLILELTEQPLLNTP